MEIEDEEQVFATLRQSHQFDPRALSLDYDRFITSCTNRKISIPEWLVVAVRIRTVPRKCTRVSEISAPAPGIKPKQTSPSLPPKPDPTRARDKSSATRTPSEGGTDSARQVARGTDLSPKTICLAQRYPLQCDRGAEHSEGDRPPSALTQ